MDAFEFQHLTPCTAQAQLLPLARVGKVGSESGGANRGGKMCRCGTDLRQSVARERAVST